MKKTGELRIATALCILSLLFGFFLMNKALFHYDAIVLAESVEKSYATFHLQPSTNYRYADVILVGIVYFPFWLAGSTADFAVRFTGIMFYAASVAMLYVFLQKFSANRTLALTAAVLFAASPVYLSPNTFGKIHSISVFFLLACFYLILSPSRKNLAMAAAAYIVALASRESVLFFLPFVLALIVYAIHKKTLSCHDATTGFVVPFAVMFLMLYFAYFSIILDKTVHGTDAETAFFTYRPWNMEKAFQDLKLTHGWIIIMTASAGAIAGMITLRFPAIFLFVWMAAAFVYFSNFTTYEARYLDVALMPLFAFCGLVVSQIARWKKPAAFILFAALVYFPVSYSTQLMIPRTTYNGIYEFGKLINEKTEADARIIVQNEAPVVGYYGRRSTLGPPAGNENESIAFWQEVHRNVTAGQPIYLAFSAFFTDPGDINKQIVSQIFDFSKTYRTIDEDYHHSDIRPLRYITYLWKLAPKKEGVEATTIPAPFILK